MNFTVLRTVQEFESIEKEWNHLLSESAIHVPFLRHEYLLSWWKSLGGGEWPQGELNIILARKAADAELIGIAPFFFTLNNDGMPALMLLGSLEISDYLDFIVKPENVSAFINNLLECLKGLTDPVWEILDLYNLIDHSPTLPALKLACARLGWQYEQNRLQPAPYIILADEWDTYLAGIDKKQRHEIRRKVRRAEANQPPANWYIVDSASNLESEMEAFMQLMAQDANKANFLTPTMRQQMQDIAKIAQDQGWLNLSFLEFGGSKAAAYFCFDYSNHIWVYNSGINPDYAHLSPGWVLLSYLIEWAIQKGHSGFDFMRGDELYKYRFGAIDRFVMRAKIKK